MNTKNDHGKSSHPQKNNAADHDEFQKLFKRYTDPQVRKASDALFKATSAELRANYLPGNTEQPAS